ncbi:Lsr2 family protein [Kineococcus sp. TBRC 1896]|uniref:Lsr2 family protein n=1 Tax=Kineococcus mangrovi TaxID=1660183 RepID=A0ABV4I9F7_9ACTN
MAQRSHTVLTDDVDGGQAVETVAFGLDGVSYEIDLSTTNAAALRRAVSPYLEHGRALTSRRRSTRTTGARVPGTTDAGTGAGSGADGGAVHAWAREDDVPVDGWSRGPAPGPPVSHP